MNLASSTANRQRLQSYAETESACAISSTVEPVLHFLRRCSSEIDDITSLFPYFLAYLHLFKLTFASSPATLSWTLRSPTSPAIVRSRLKNVWSRLSREESFCILCCLCLIAFLDCFLDDVPILRFSDRSFRWYWRAGRWLAELNLIMQPALSKIFLWVAFDCSWQIGYSF